MSLSVMGEQVSYVLCVVNDPDFETALRESSSSAFSPTARPARATCSIARVRIQGLTGLGNALVLQQNCEELACIRVIFHHEYSETVQRGNCFRKSLRGPALPERVLGQKREADCECGAGARAVTFLRRQPTGTRQATPIAVTAKRAARKASAV
jgi:hypothetical protein